MRRRGRRRDSRRAGGGVSVLTGERVLPPLPSAGDLRHNDRMSATEPFTIAGTWVTPETVAERMAAGRAARRETPRSALSVLTVGERDPLGILNRQNADRVQELIPLRMRRMLQSPFAFYRGTAGIQAADLSRRDALSGIQVIAAATRTSATSASTPRPSAASSST